MTKVLDDPENASQLERETFRKYCRMPVELLKEVVDELKRGGFEDKSGREGKRGPPGHRLDVYVVASLRKLATGNSFKDEELWSGISAQSLHAFFDEFIEYYGYTAFEDHVYMPDEDTLKKYERIGNLCGFPGCFGKVDGTNLLCNKYPYSRRIDAMSGYKLKGQTSVNVLVIVSPTGEAIHASPNYPGATNDARIAQEDAGIRALTSEPRYRDFKYHLFTRNGEKVERTGAYFIADGGFGYDRRLVSTFRVVIDEKDNEGFFNDVHESLRSGVESYFGRLKQRFQIIKNGFYAQDEQKIQLIVRTVLAINNIIMRFDQMNEIGERDNDFCLINCEVKDVGEDVNLNYPTFCRRGQIHDDERVKRALIRFDRLEGQRTDRVDDLGERNDPDDPDHTRIRNFHEHRDALVENIEHRAKTNTLFWPKKFDEVFKDESSDDEGDDD